MGFFRKAEKNKYRHRLSTLPVGQVAMSASVQIVNYLRFIALPLGCGFELKIDREAGRNKFAVSVFDRLKCTVRAVVEQRSSSEVQASASCQRMNIGE